jgi:hypothetical protein
VKFVNFERATQVRPFQEGKMLRFVVAKSEWEGWFSEEKNAAGPAINGVRVRKLTFRKIIVRKGVTFYQILSFLFF